MGGHGVRAEHGERAARSTVARSLAFRAVNSPVVPDTKTPEKLKPWYYYQNHRSIRPRRPLGR
jgi:hypothetical protein